ncbi:hypothetical protein QMZ05_27695 [Bradyrhizobium sp. INPA03-11B]|uniref:hypothetical protein n=1 Tax=Bradyrhizobium sp. INPA03-11B TaxID=418598 RepID=UPI00338F5813
MSTRKIPNPPRAPLKAGETKLPQPSRKLLARLRAKAEIDLIRVAWTAAGESARRQFLAELMSPACKRPKRGGWTASTPGDEDATVGEFVKACVIADVGQRVRSTVLYEAYRGFSINSGKEPVSHKTFSLRLSGMGYRRHYSNVIWFVGLRLIDGGDAS